MQSESIAYEKALLFAKRIVYLSRYLNAEHHEYVIAKQILRSGTSIGANIAEARCGSSRKDFVAKIYVALKECSETIYWLDLLHITDLLSDEEFASLQSDCEALRKILSSTTATVRAQDLKSSL